MHVKMQDGQAVFATGFIQLTMTDDLRSQLRGHQCEPDGIVCYSDAETTTAKSTLDGLKVTYTVQPQTVDPSIVAKAKAVTYASRSEILGHLQNGNVPHSMTVPNLMQDIAAIKKHLGL